MTAPLWPARLHHLRRDSAEPERLARVYGELLGDRVEALPNAEWLVQGHGRRLVVGSGAKGAVRHGPGNNLFFMIEDPDGHKVEFSAELERMPEEAAFRTWPHEQRTLNLWGSAWMRS